MSRVGKYKLNNNFERLYFDTFTFPALIKK